MERALDFMLDLKARLDALHAGFIALTATISPEARRATLLKIEAAAKAIDELNGEQRGGESVIEETSHRLNMELRLLAQAIRDAPPQSDHQQ